MAYRGFVLRVLKACLLTLLFLFSIHLSLSYGSTGYRPFYTLDINSPIIELRLSRTILAILTGVSLAVAGSLIQVATRNSLASPWILGLQSGALTAALLTMLINGIPTRVEIVLSAFIGSLTAYGLAISIASLAGMTALSLVLGGIAVSSMLAGVSHLLIYLVQTKLRGQPVLILFGSLSLPSSKEIPLYIATTLCGVAIAIVMWKQINAIVLGDDFAIQLGYDPRLIRLVLSAIAALLTAASVSFVGIVSFVGLIAPHIARLIVGDDARKHLPFCAISGALIVLLADVFIRMISAHSTLGELPLSIPTSIVGACVLSYLIVARGRG
ncbi:MAG TPA: iron ABC transporter permease [Ignisphaera aggregans]|uniref:Iron ABC transporter permease n=1 Tax=Ignisphaera aggregans TaxID=334771 RepID=A0A832YYV0_9CREN|nr:iron ABC transporter permease [Ignisphaera aggregans]